MSICLAPARAAASRRNGARSGGPRTAEGKARSAQNALKHGLCAQKFVVLDDEDAGAFAALEAALLEELAPQGVLQRLLAGRIVRAAWRLERAERIETELFACREGGEKNLALALIRDGNATRSFDTLLRYRGSALAEFFRALRMLQALQDDAKAIVVPVKAAPKMSAPQERNEPEARGNAGLIVPPATSAMAYLASMGQVLGDPAALMPPGWWLDHRLERRRTK
jgi:hypothetical protein